MTSSAEDRIPVDTDKLPPTQMLILETLTGRWRTGEDCWTFHPKLGKAMKALAALGLIGFWERSDGWLVAHLTERQLAELRASTFVTPVQKQIDTLKRRIAFLEETSLDLLADRLTPLVIELVTSRQSAEGAAS